MMLAADPYLLRNCQNPYRYGRAWPSGVDALQWANGDKAVDMAGLGTPYLDAFKISKLYKIFHYIESLNAYMKY